MFYAEDEIRVLKEDSFDIIFKFNDPESSNGIKILSFVAVDNFELDDFTDRHAFVEKAEIPCKDTFTRLIKRNSDIKQMRAHTFVNLRKELKKKSKFEHDEEKFKSMLVDKAYQEIFAVEYFE